MTRAHADRRGGLSDATAETTTPVGPGRGWPPDGAGPPRPPRHAPLPGVGVPARPCDRASGRPAQPHRAVGSGPGGPLVGDRGALGRRDRGGPAGRDPSGGARRDRGWDPHRVGGGGDGLGPGGPGRPVLVALAPGPPALASRPESPGGARLGGGGGGCVRVMDSRPLGRRRRRAGGDRGGHAGRRPAGPPVVFAALFGPGQPVRGPGRRRWAGAGLGLVVGGRRARAPPATRGRRDGAGGGPPGIDPLGGRAAGPQAWPPPRRAGGTAVVPGRLGGDRAGRWPPPLERGRSGRLGRPPGRRPRRSPRRRDRRS